MRRDGGARWTRVDGITNPLVTTAPCLLKPIKIGDFCRTRKQESLPLSRSLGNFVSRQSRRRGFSLFFLSGGVRAFSRDSARTGSTGPSDIYGNSIEFRISLRARAVSGVAPQRSFDSLAPAFVRLPCVASFFFLFSSRLLSAAMGYFLKLFFLLWSALASLFFASPTFICSVRSISSISWFLRIPLDKKGLCNL